MLVAGAGAGITFTIGGAFTFNVDGLPSASWLSYGSANKFSLLVWVLMPLLPLVALLRLM